MEEKRTCRQCEYYTDFLDDNGYCTHYRHYIANEETVCSKYSENKNITQSIPMTDIAVAPAAKTVTKPKRLKESPPSKFTYALFFTSSIFTVLISSLFALLCVGLICSSYDIGTLGMSLLSLLGAAIISFFAIVFFFIGRRFRVARVSMIIISLTLIVLFIVGRDVMHLALQDIIVALFKP